MSSFQISERVKISNHKQPEFRQNLPRFVKDSQQKKD